ncbi:MAG: DNA alkylation repair protein [Acidimicrobiia bacterium]|nr:DNA alkylation repair protein [Acidimicrobiia bacterium]
MGDAPLLKDFIDRESVAAVARAVSTAAGGLNEDEVVGQVLDDEWEDRALKQRIRHIAVTVRAFLPEDYGQALTIMRAAAQVVDAGWMSVWAFNDFVEEYGVDQPDLSLPALEQFTKLASAEFAVRPFIARYPDRMAAQMLEWARDEDPLVRRLASEGFRPRLPWGMGLPALKQDPSPILPVLAELRQDPSEDVRRSVANNLNDISKDHPELVVDLLAVWGDGTPEMEALTKHALRTLLKKGHPGALQLLGFGAADVNVDEVVVTPAQGRIGEHVTLEFTVTSTAADTQLLMVDYAVVFQNVSGTGSRKVFKGTVADLGAGESLKLRRKMSLAQQTTRRIIPGPHSVDVQVNGAVLASAQFDVVE